jgi:hypothetical protein
MTNPTQGKEPDHMFQFTDARVVTLVVASEVGPFRVDIAVQSHPLDPKDPMRPGDVMLWAEESDADDPGARLWIAGALEAAAAALRGAQ